MFISYVNAISDSCSSCQCVFARQMRSTSQFDKTILSKCVCVSQYFTTIQTLTHRVFSSMLFHTASDLSTRVQKHVNAWKYDAATRCRSSDRTDRMFGTHSLHPPWHLLLGRNQADSDRLLKVKVDFCTCPWSPA